MLQDVPITIYALKGVGLAHGDHGAPVPEDQIMAGMITRSGVCTAIRWWLGGLLHLGSFLCSLERMASLLCVPAFTNLRDLKIVQIFPHGMARDWHPYIMWHVAYLYHHYHGCCKC